MANQQARGHWPVPFARLLVFTLASLTPFQGDAQSKKCGSQYLGEEISYHNLAEYDETLGRYPISHSSVCAAGPARSNTGGWGRRAAGLYGSRTERGMGR